MAAFNKKNIFLFVPEIVFSAFCLPVSKEKPAWIIIV